MPTQLHIVKARDFIRLNTSGVIDFERSRKALAQIAEALSPCGVDHAIIDIRGTETGLSITEIYKLATAFRDFGTHKADRVAILTRHSRLDRADFFASLASNPGLVVGAFDSYEEAVEWLFSSEAYNPAHASAMMAEGERVSRPMP